MAGEQSSFPEAEWSLVRGQREKGCVAGLLAYVGCCFGDRILLCSLCSPFPLLHLLCQPHWLLIGCDPPGSALQGLRF